MAKVPTKKLSKEELHDAQMRGAVEAIAANGDLRYFMWQFFLGCGIQSTPDGGNAIETAKLIGRHSIAMDLIVTMSRYDPTLYPQMLEADLKTVYSNEGAENAVD